MEEKKRIFTVLCIDGGGVRGVIPARILQEIEERTGQPISALFDLVGGASTGAIVAAGVVAPAPDDPARPRNTAEQVKNFYYEHCPKIFPEMKFKSLRKISSSALYDPKPLEDALEANLGDTKMSETLTHLMIPATDIKNFRPVWISAVKGQKDNSPEGWGSMKLRDAVRASASAPTYLPAKYYTTTPDEEIPNITHRHALIDGGFFAGNSLRRMLTQAKRLAPPDAEIVLVHVGTGNSDHSLSPEEFNKLGPIGLVSKSSGSLLMSLVVSINVMDVAEDVREEIGSRFISFDGVIDRDDPKAPARSLDDSSLENLQALERFAENVISAKHTEMDRLCNLLGARLYQEECHQQSKAALQYLTEKLEEQKTVRSLARLYRKVLNHASDIDGKPADGNEDAKISEMSRALNDRHRGELDRIYNVIQDKLENQNRFMNAMRETTSKLGKIFKRHSDRPADGSNDNTPPGQAPRRQGNEPK